MYSKPQFMQGVYRFEGTGLTNTHLLSPQLTYTVPTGKRAQFVYFRAGNSSAEMICILLVRDGVPMRYFPVGAKGDVHVALAVVEDLTSGTTLEAHLGAPEGVSGSVVLDIGLVEI
jgi:assimilatory nitrate reductase catalytic subunit